jgi:hypothetical protein
LDSAGFFALSDVVLSDFLAPSEEAAADDDEADEEAAARESVR